MKINKTMEKNIKLLRKLSLSCDNYLELINEYGHEENEENEEITLTIENLISDFIENLEDIILEYVMCKKAEDMSKEK